MLEIPGFEVALAGQALVLHAYGEQHFVPIAQATAQTMCDVQLLVKARQANLLAEFNVETTRRLDENQSAAEVRLVH